MSDSTELETNRMTGRLWRLVAIGMAELHREDARMVVDEICSGLAEHCDQVAILMDAMSAFKAEASKRGLR